MRYPRTSINGKLRIGTQPSHVVCHGEGWDNLTVVKRDKGKVSELATHSQTRSQRRERAQATAKPTEWAAKVEAQRIAWENASPGAEKRDALKRLRYLEIKAGIRDASGQSVELDYMGETWANHA